ncbi:MAG: J domain-containing protein [Alphaproteobacteria bacterium]
MTELAIDIGYVYAVLGVLPGEDPAHLRVRLEDAAAYPYITATRRHLVQRIATFLEHRALFGSPEDSCAQIRRVYYRRAMALHPDRNDGDRVAEDALKLINAAYGTVEAMRREAEEYFGKSRDERQVIEIAAQQDAAREAREPYATPSPPPENFSDDFSYEDAPAPKPRAKPRHHNKPHGVRYCAASVPRYIRNARLFYLGIHAVIGSRLVQNNSGGLVYDIIMLPEQEFMRAKLLLSLPVGETSSVDLSPTKITPAYNPMDAKCVTIPPGTHDPYHYARNWFMEKFGLNRPEPRRDD